MKHIDSNFAGHHYGLEAHELYTIVENSPLEFEAEPSDSSPRRSSICCNCPCRQGAKDSWKRACVGRIVSLSTMPHVNEDVSAFVRSEICLFPTASVTTLCRPATCNVCGACLEWCLTRDDWTDDQQRSCMDNPNITQKCALSSDAVAVHNPACMMYLPELSDLFRLYRRRVTAELKPSSRHGRFLGRFGRRVLTGARFAHDRNSFTSLHYHHTQQRPWTVLANVSTITFA
jgi:hypothetical protein